jgi:hypothetical protein
MSEGLKNDNGKLDWSLLDFDLIEPLIPVLILGESRYGFENWKKDFGPNYRRRFQAARMRHEREARKNSLAINEADGQVYHSLAKLRKEISNDTSDCETDHY